VAARDSLFLIVLFKCLTSKESIASFLFLFFKKSIISLTFLESEFISLETFANFNASSSETAIFPEVC